MPTNLRDFQSFHMMSEFWVGIFGGRKQDPLLHYFDSINRRYGKILQRIHRSSARNELDWYAGVPYIPIPWF